MKGLRIFISILCSFNLLFFFPLPHAMASNIADSKHNLSKWGKGQIKSKTEEEICVFCHTPHHSDPAAPLWNRFPSGVKHYKLPSSSTLFTITDNRQPQPDGDSKLCLSCHDGTIALSSVIMLRGVRNDKNKITRRTEFIGATQEGTMPGNSGEAYSPNLGMDLSGSHPISIPFNPELINDKNNQNSKGLTSFGLNFPRPDDTVKLKPTQNTYSGTVSLGVQCTSCHSPHDDSRGKFLLKGSPDQMDPLCESCHIVSPFSDTSSLSGRVTHMDTNKFHEGCGSCHAGHGKSSTPMLKKSKDELCLDCHTSREKITKEPITKEPVTNGLVTKETLTKEPVTKRVTAFNSIARTDIRGVIERNQYIRNTHNVLEDSKGHHAYEETVESNPHTKLHVSCQDCHNVHTLSKDKPLGNVRGVDSRGSEKAKVENEYELCYRCHGDNANLPANEKNKREEFNKDNFKNLSASYHPVEGSGKNKKMQSLRGSKYNETSIIKCTDCHGNNDPRGPKGPHGSNYEHILISNYSTQDNFPESSQQYGLCYKCHNRNSILRDESFKSHKKHIVDIKTSCFTCHSSHGSSSPNLISFNHLVVLPNKDGRLGYDIGGTCYLRCHGVDHPEMKATQTGIQRNLEQKGRGQPYPSPLQPQPPWPLLSPKFPQGGGIYR